jgi:hypothetical protein
MRELTPLNIPDIQSAVEAALVKSEVIAANETAKEILNTCGASLEQVVTSLANLSLTAKDNVKHAVIRDILDIHGVKFRQETQVDTKPVICFNIQADNAQVNMNQLFAPKRS